MAKNYYLILGVPAHASADEIKAAFRRRARELHPDTSGLESGPFLQVQEAYGVLSHPERRREYDKQAIQVRRRPQRSSAEPLVPPRRPPEPFSAPTIASHFQDVRFGPEFGKFQPSFDDLLDWLWSDFE